MQGQEGRDRERDVHRLLLRPSNIELQKTGNLIFVAAKYLIRVRDDSQHLGFIIQVRIWEEIFFSRLKVCRFTDSRRTEQLPAEMFFTYKLFLFAVDKPVIFKQADDERVFP